MRKNLLAPQALAPQVVAREAPHLGQPVRETRDRFELLPLLALAVVVVEAVPEPAGRVVACGVHLRRRAPGYPVVLPVWRHLRVLYPGQDPPLAHALLRAGAVR